MGTTENNDKEEVDDTEREVDRTLLESDSSKSKELPSSGAVSVDEKIKLTGLNLCYITIGLIGLVAVILIIYYFVATSSLESMIGSPTKDTIQIYKDARAAITDDIVKISDRFLGSILLPILTLLMGYMFGSREEKPGK